MIAKCSDLENNKCCKGCLNDLNYSEHNPLSEIIYKNVIITYCCSHEEWAFNTLNKLKENELPNNTINKRLDE